MTTTPAARDVDALVIVDAQVGLFVGEHALPGAASLSCALASSSLVHAASARPRCTCRTTDPLGAVDEPQQPGWHLHLPPAADVPPSSAVPDEQEQPPTAATAPGLGDDTVILDAYRADDVGAMQAGVDPEIIRWINDGHLSTADEDAAAVTRWATSWATGGSQRTWAVRDRHTGQLLGGCEARLDSPGTAAFSYWVYPEHRGRGLAARALTLVVDHAFTAFGVLRAELLIEVDNLASQRVAAAAGFHREGVLRAVFDHRGDRVDAVSWSRLPTDPPPAITAAG